MIRYPRLLNPGKADNYLARDLAAWISTYGDLQPFYRRGQTFIEKGTYDSDKASKLFMNAVNNYYKAYAHDNSLPIHLLNAPTRRLAATKLKGDFERVFRSNKGRRKHNCGPDGVERDKWIPAHAVRFNKDGSVSMMR